MRTTTEQTGRLETRSYVETMARDLERMDSSWPGWRWTALSKNAEGRTLEKRQGLRDAGEALDHYETFCAEGHEATVYLVATSPEGEQRTVLTRLGR